MKGNRQEEILRIIEEKIINTQDDLQRELNGLGYNVTQSTVSRDIKQLRLIKGHDKSGNYRYIKNHSDIYNANTASHYNDIIKRSTVSVECACNDIVIKCYNGMAQSVCVAIDNMFKNEMVGSIAGDDTIFIVTRSDDAAILLSDEIRKLL